MYKKVTIVNEYDEVIGSENLFPAIEKGLIRQVSRVFVFDTDGKALLQKRSGNVMSPYLLDQSVGGHVDEGETYLEAALREMREEIGLTDIPLIEVVLSYRTEVFNGIYKAVVPVGIPIDFDTEEVECIVWMTPEEVDAAIAQRPQDFTTSFPGVWTELRDKLVG